MDDFNDIIVEMNPRLLKELLESKKSDVPSPELLILMEQMLIYYSKYKHMEMPSKIHDDCMGAFLIAWRSFNPKKCDNPFMFFYIIVKSVCVCSKMK